MDSWEILGTRRDRRQRTRRWYRPQWREISSMEASGRFVAHPREQSQRKYCQYVYDCDLIFIWNLTPEAEI